jgi:hypothetical protein
LRHVIWLLLILSMGFVLSTTFGRRAGEATSAKCERARIHSVWAAQGAGPVREENAPNEQTPSPGEERDDNEDDEDPSTPVAFACATAELLSRQCSFGASYWAVDEPDLQVGVPPPRA